MTDKTDAVYSKMSSFESDPCNSCDTILASGMSNDGTGDQLNIAMDILENTGMGMRKSKRVDVTKSPRPRHKGLQSIVTESNYVDSKSL